MAGAGARERLLRESGDAAAVGAGLPAGSAGFPVRYRKVVLHRREVSSRDEPVRPPSAGVPMPWAVRPGGGWGIVRGGPRHLPRLPPCWHGCLEEAFLGDLAVDGRWFQRTVAAPAWRRVPWRRRPVFGTALRGMSYQRTSGGTLACGEARLLSYTHPEARDLVCRSSTGRLSPVLLEVPGLAACRGCPEVGEPPEAPVSSLDRCYRSSSREAPGLQ